MRRGCLQIVMLRETKSVNIHIQDVPNPIGKDFLRAQPPSPLPTLSHPGLKLMAWRALAHASGLQGVLTIYYPRLCFGPVKSINIYFEMKNNVILYLFDNCTNDFVHSEHYISLRFNQ